MNVEDQLAIQQVIAQYSYTFDAKDAQGWAALFTEDALWECVTLEGGPPLNRLEGRQAIHDWAVKQHGTIPDNVRSYHHQSGILFDELGADTARTRVMVAITSQVPGDKGFKTDVNLTGVYHDQWRRTDQGWRFSERILKL